MVDEEPDVETFWVTTYAITKGIMRVEGEDRGGYLSGVAGYPGFFERIGKDAHRTREAAEDRVRMMITAKLTSIEKQVSKLEKMRKKVKYAKGSE